MSQFSSRKNVRAFLSVAVSENDKQNRYECTLQCLDSFVRTSNPFSVRHKTTLDVFDVASTHKPTIELLERMGKINGINLITLTQGDIAGSFWTKNLAWRLFLESLEPHGIDAIVMLDNDVRFTADWLDHSLSALSDGDGMGVNIVSPYDGKPRYPSTRIGGQTGLAAWAFALGGVDCYLRKASTSRCWVMLPELVFGVEPPTDKAVTRNGRVDRMPTDWYYWKQLERTGGNIAVLMNPLVFDTEAKFYSERVARYIGDDAHRQHGLSRG